VPAEPGHFAHRVSERLGAARQRPQGKHLAALLRTHGDAVPDRMPPQLIQRVFIHRIRSQVDVLGILLQYALPPQEFRRLEAR